MATRIILQAGIILQGFVRWRTSSKCQNAITEGWCESLTGLWMAGHRCHGAPMCAAKTEGSRWRSHLEDRGSTQESCWKGWLCDLLINFIFWWAIKTQLWGKYRFHFSLCWICIPFLSSGHGKKNKKEHKEHTQNKVGLAHTCLFFCYYALLELCSKLQTFC